MVVVGRPASGDGAGQAAERTEEEGGAAAAAALAAAVDVIAAVGEARPRERELDLLNVLLELPVVDEGVLPLRDELRLQFLGELHHSRRRRSPSPPCFLRLRTVSDQEERP